MNKLRSITCTRKRQIDVEGNLIIMVEIDLSVHFEGYEGLARNRNSTIGFEVTEFI